MTAVKKHQSIAIAILATVTAAALFFAAWVSAVGVSSSGAASKGTTACFNTSKGTVFLRTVCKAGERKVVLGLPGATGAVGPSAFDLAKVGGFSGTVAEWLGSLVGISGLVGDAGNVGVAGATGQKGDKGLQGEAGFIPAYGSFYDTTTQTNKVWKRDEASKTPYSPREFNAFTFDSSPIKEAGVTVKGGQIIFAKAGTYNIQFSAQLFANTAITAEQIDIWLSKNGSNVEFSNTQVQVPSIDGKTAKAVAAWNFVVRVEAGEYCELRWVSSAETMSITAVGAESTPAGVAVPSVILTVTQVG